LFCAASHGTGHHLLKAGSKRRRTRADIDEAMLMDEAK
jgi:hypothetical protein